MNALEKQRNLEHERREWIFQRIGWGTCALFLAAAAAGILEAGPLSRTTVFGDRFELEYARTAHRGAPHALTVRLVGDAPVGEVWFAGDWIASTRVEDVIPHPSEIVVSSERLTLAFEDGVRAPFEIRLSTRAHEWGVLRHEVGVDPNAAGVPFEQLMLP